MNLAVKIPTVLQQFGWVGLGAPVLVIMVLAMVVLPLPTPLLDLLFTFNIALSLAVILGVIYVMQPLEFGVFPTVLLFGTLLRLGLNVASTRIVLLEGHTGTDAAGRVIEAFGDFVIGGNYAVGLVVFAILVVINFVVVTKGATRVAEVTARFTLDALPGKQMAIDADLNAGLLNEETARERREGIRQEADFYGAMDGASKFVRGDAIAGIIILLINLVGGLAIGMAQHGMGFGQAVQVYALLTVGDGLVAQIPALLLSTSVAIIVTRMSRAQDMSSEVLQQVFGQTRVLMFTAIVLGIVGLIPGMPNFIFLLLAASIGTVAWFLQRRQDETQALEDEEPEPQVVTPESGEPEWENVSTVDAVGLEVGYRLVPLVDNDQGGELMARIKGVRKKLSHALGFVIQPVHIRDNLELPPTRYRITIYGVTVAEDEVRPDRELAINPGDVTTKLQGQDTKDPAFGMPAVWIEPASREHAQMMGYTVADSATVIATHLSRVLNQHAYELLGHQEVQQMLDVLAKDSPKLVENLTPKTLPLSLVVRVLQLLLAEKVPVRNMRVICETLVDAGSRSQDPETLLAAVRASLGRQIVQNIVGTQQEVPVITLAPELEQLLQNVVEKGDTGALEPGLSNRLQDTLKETAQQQQSRGEPAVLLVPQAIRSMLNRFCRQAVPGIQVLAHSEVPEDKQLRLVGSVQS